MNLLPFVIIIVLVLGMFSLSQFRRTNSLEQEKNTYVAYFKGLREARNDVEDSAYAQARTPNSSNKPSESTTTTEKNDDIKKRPFFRDRKIGWPGGRLNLSSLLDDTQDTADLEKITLGYLKALYGNKSFFPKNPKTFLKHLVAKLKANEETIPLHELVLDDPTMQDTFYKMLRGTHTYDIIQEKGYPPFDHFFTFEKNSEPPMNFHSANVVFLNVALGKNLADNLIKKEREMSVNKPNSLKSPLEKGEVENLFGEAFSSQLSLFSFKSSGRWKNPEIYIDDQTKITVRIE